MLHLQRGLLAGFVLEQTPEEVSLPWPSPTLLEAILVLLRVAETNTWGERRGVAGTDRVEACPAHYCRTTL